MFKVKYNVMTLMIFVAWAQVEVGMPQLHSTPKVRPKPNACVAKKLAEIKARNQQRLQKQKQDRRK